MSLHASLRKITNWRQAFFATLALTILYSTASAADRYSELVLEDKPVGYWRLEKAEDGRVLNEVELPDSTVSLVGAITGEVRLASSGPQAGEFPLFAPDNAAAEFAADGGFIRVTDAGADSPLDFANGDALTLEAWVSPQATGAGRFLYVIGKGRTETSGRLAVNQNYALRLKTLPGDKAALSFLFHSADEPAADKKTDGEAAEERQVRRQARGQKGRLAPLDLRRLAGHRRRLAPCGGDLRVRQAEEHQGLYRRRKRQRQVGHGRRDGTGAGSR